MTCMRWIDSWVLGTCLLLLAAMSGCDRPGSHDGDPGATIPAIAASSSYLASATRDVLGSEEPVLVLAEPGMCPGHFDLRPSQVQQLRGCQILLRFDFQSSLDQRILDGSDTGPQVVAVNVPGGMCEPESYLSVCRQIADAMVQRGRLSTEQAEQRCALISQRLRELAEWAHQEVSHAQLENAAILSSGHQAAFCTWLGLRVVAKFSGVDSAQPSEVDQAIAAGETADLRLIIANRPEGRQLAEALAERLDSRVVVFENFPKSNDVEAFDEMVRGNVRSMVEVIQP